ncbi:MAG TPA: HAD hydrolase-like protein [Thermoanaerobaculia bacterium]
MNLLFDLDGTLTDPGMGITRCIQHALVSLGRPVPAMEVLRRYIGPPLQGTFAELLETEEEARVAEAVRLYRERFVTTGMFENSVYPEIPGGLEALQRAGHRMWVATSKPHVFAREIVRHFGLDGFFESVYGSELSGVNAEKGALIREIIVHEMLSPGETCMIGDRSYDIAGARANGIGAIAVLWGYGSPEELNAAGPDRIVASMRELCEHAGGRP